MHDFDDTLALCKCGVDMMDHISWDEESLLSHPFTASGTKYRCGAYLDNGYFCALPRTHEDDGYACGPVLGEGY